MLAQWRGIMKCLQRFYSICIVIPSLAFSILLSLPCKVLSSVERTSSHKANLLLRYFFNVSVAEVQVFGYFICFFVALGCQRKVIFDFVALLILTHTLAEQLIRNTFYCHFIFYDFRVDKILSACSVRVFKQHSNLFHASC